MPIATTDTTLIRDLARQVAAIAADPVHDIRRDMWRRLNRLERVRPLVHIQAIAWNIWEELIPPDSLEAADPFVREQEQALRRRIYCWEHFRDDRVVDAVVPCPIAIQGEITDIDFGMEKNLAVPDDRSGAHAYRAVIHTESDIDKICSEPNLTVDRDETENRYQRLCDLYDGILKVEKRGKDFYWFSPMDRFIQWRGIEQMFVDLIERPAWIHAALERITRGYLSNIEQLEQLGALSPGHGNTMLGSGGYGFTDELPQPDADNRSEADHRPGTDGPPTRIRDLWARAATQIFTEGTSPDMHDEFAVQYEKRLLHPFGLSCYGCCEPLDGKMHVVRSIENLRRVSMSPWVDVARASEEVGADYVYTHKPNPSVVSTPTWDLDLARRDLRDAFEKTRDNVLEVNLQDLHTVQNQPHRLTEWTAMALQLAEEYA